jgi:hypothetical protein
LTKEEYEFIGKMRGRNTVTAIEQTEVNRIYNRVFKDSVKPTNCGSCEVKHKYPFTDATESFKFDTVSFLGRKKKYGDFWYVIVCGETEALLLCSFAGAITKRSTVKSKR